MRSLGSPTREQPPLAAAREKPMQQEDQHKPKQVKKKGKESWRLDTWQIHKKLIPTCRVLAIRVETIFVFLKVNNTQNNPEYIFRSSKQNTELS